MARLSQRQRATIARDGIGALRLFQIRPFAGFAREMPTARDGRIRRFAPTADASRSGSAGQPTSLPQRPVSASDA